MSGSEFARARRHVVVAIAALAIIGLAGMPGIDLVTPAAAADIPKLLMHLVPSIGRPRCLGASELPTCAQVVVEGDLAVEYDLYLLAADIEATAGIGGATFVLRSSSPNPASLEFQSWTSCATGQSVEPGWPAFDRQVSAWWNPVSACQRSEPNGPGSGAMAVVGVLRILATDHATIYLTGKSRLAELVDCGGNSYELWDDDQTSVVTLGGNTGIPASNPCSATTVEDCLLPGPDICAPGERVAIGPVDSRIAVTAIWNVTGPGALDGPVPGGGIWIRAGDSGAFTVTYSFSGTHTAGFCTRTVTIDPLLPVSPTTWGRIKALSGVQ